MSAHHEDAKQTALYGANYPDIPIRNTFLAYLERDAEVTALRHDIERLTASALATENEELRRQVEQEIAFTLNAEARAKAAEKDAARYRWLRERSDDLKGCWFFPRFPSYKPYDTYPDRAGLDAAIDSAIADSK